MKQTRGILDSLARYQKLPGGFVNDPFKCYTPHVAYTMYVHPSINVARTIRIVLYYTSQASVLMIDESYLMKISAGIGGAPPPIDAYSLQHDWFLETQPGGRLMDLLQLKATGSRGPACG